MHKIKSISGKTAHDILHETGQENVIPVNLNKILRHYEISAVAFDFTELERMVPREVSERGHILGAMVTTQTGNTAIFYREDEELMSKHRHRFTVAHELGHCSINGEPNHIEFRQDGTSDDEVEREANIFAGELLIPLNQLESVSKKLILPTIKNLAQVFEVSDAVMAARLEYLDRPDLYIYI